MHHAFLHISLPSTARLPVKMPNFKFCEGREQAITKFILFMNLDMVDRNSAPEEFACMWQSKRVEIITIETEEMWIHFSKRRFQGCQPSWYLLKELPNIYARRDRFKRKLPVINSTLYFRKSVFSFRSDSILKSHGDYCVYVFEVWTRQAVIETS